ncbi:MAG: outer membrane beta-barrel protein [Deltaproteobacteria bacterium]|nr:outer membrane beta-barrel protein [Deltaproteobacteria bacterium]
MKKRYLGVILTILFLLPAISASADDRVFKPYVSASLTQSDNAFMTSTLEESDNIVKLTAGLLVDYKSEAGHSITLDYKYIDEHYETYDLEDTVSNIGTVILNLKLSPKLRVILNGNYTQSHEPRSLSATGEIEKYEVRNPSGSVIIGLTDMASIQLDYNVAQWKFDNDLMEYRNRQTGYGEAYLLMRMLPKVAFFISYNRTDNIYDVVDPATSQLYTNMTTTAAAGFKWGTKDASNGTIKAGVTNKYYEYDNLEGVESLTGSIDLKQYLGENFYVTLLANKEIYESSDFEIRYTIATGAFAEAALVLYEGLTVFGNYSNYTDEFSDIQLGYTVEREDLRTTMGGGISYTYRDIVTATVAYEQRERDSNIDTNDYLEARTSGTLTIAF